MKKTLIALAALAATGATLAQSAVTIYGRLDLGVSSTDITQRGWTPEGLAAGPGPVAGPNFGTGSSDTFSLAGAQDQMTGSRLGFRGTEDLGRGLRAGFVYEIGINADRQTAHTLTATPGSTVPLGNAQTRLANLSLSGGFGTVQVGTFMNVFDAVRRFSPNTTAVGVPGGDFMAAHGPMDWTLWYATPVATLPPLPTQVGGRSENAIAYVSPVFSGFTFSVGTMNEDVSTRNAAGVEQTRTDVRGLLLGLGYSQGPLAVQLAFGDVDVSERRVLAPTPAAPWPDADGDLRNWSLGVRYTLAPVVLSFIYEDARLTMNDVPATLRITREFDAWEIGARFPMGAFAPYITFGQGDITLRAGPYVENTDTSAWQIGTTYNLSTRTWVYAAFGETEFEQAAYYGFNRQIDGYRIGLVHTF